MGHLVLAVVPVWCEPSPAEARTPIPNSSVSQLGVTHQAGHEKPTSKPPT